MADISEKTITDELREAAARAREDLVPAAEAHPIPGSPIVAVCGNHVGISAICDNCVHFDARDMVLARLIVVLINAREPLASWLESAARVAREHPQDPDYAGLPDTRFCTTCQDEETTCVAFVAGALAVVEAFKTGTNEGGR